MGQNQDIIAASARRRIRPGSRPPGGHLRAVRQRAGLPHCSHLRPPQGADPGGGADRSMTPSIWRKSCASSLTAGTSRCSCFPGYHVLALKFLSYHNETAAERIRVLYRLTSDDTPPVVIAPVSALLQRLIPRRELNPLRRAHRGRRGNRPRAPDGQAHRRRLPADRHRRGARGFFRARRDPGRVLAALPGPAANRVFRRPGGKPALLRCRPTSAGRARWPKP